MKRRTLSVLCWITAGWLCLPGASLAQHHAESTFLQSSGILDSRLIPPAISAIDLARRSPLMLAPQPAAGALLQTQPQDPEPRGDRIFRGVIYGIAIGAVAGGMTGVIISAAEGEGSGEGWGLFNWVSRIAILGAGGGIVGGIIGGVVAASSGS
ncbi:hypothetical protein BH24GEM2_BH24GEM2_14010 [soil metagenome]